MSPNARLCKAMLDRLTDQAHIIDTGKESYRFRRTMERKKGGKGAAVGIIIQSEGAHFKISKAKSLGLAGSASGRPRRISSYI